MSMTIDSYSFRSSLYFSTGTLFLGMFLSGTQMTTSYLGISFLRRRLFFELSVTTSPPRRHPQASSNAPVMVTPHSLAHSTPSLITSRGSHCMSKWSNTDDITALQTELELFSPMEGGMSDLTVSS